MVIDQLIVYVQFLPVVDGEGKEKELITNVMKKLLAENDFSGLDINKVKNLTYRFSYSVVILVSNLDYHSYGLMVLS